MKLEVSRRRLADPTFNYRKLKQELQSQGQTTVQSQSVAHSGANLPGEGGFHKILLVQVQDPLLMLIQVLGLEVL